MERRSVRSAKRCRREAAVTGQRWEVPMGRDGGGTSHRDGPAGTRSHHGVLPTWRGPAAEGRSFPGRQSKRRLPFARANQRLENSHLNAVPGNCAYLRVTERRAGCGSCAANQGRGSGYRHAVKPMGIAEGSAASPCGAVGFQRGKLLGDRRGSRAVGGSGAPGRAAAAAVMAKGRNMPKARAGGAEKASPESAERKSPGRPRAGGENVFIGQSKIYSYLNPNKTPGARPPLQDENSVMYHEVKCQGKTLNETYRKGDEKKNGGNIIEGAMKPEDQKDKEGGCKTSVPSCDQNQETVETQKTPLPSDCADEANAKPAQKKMVKAKRGPRRKTQGRTPNRKVTDYYPVRRSSRKSKSELETEERRKIDELITSGKEEGMKIDYIDGKGRGVIATKHFNRGEFVVEYHGDLIEITDARKREAVYAQDPSTGCYMYYFQYLSKTYCVDATKETNRLGRLINHSKCGNCQTKLHDIDGVPHLILIASRDIKAGEELLYDYGDRSKASIEAHPWLKH
ncbi:N-lysine methyltransferase KMT5A isoform X2 [Tyto alba]|uniref:N-lysine methyltransferase KMT5A isoform X2 n=1 Tax=Tyto alba TaxID=56313 RepID=UPI001C66AA3B|nr:N-lysine methyltransferase KMT5A isoform X2 [Tyto alba]